MTIRAYQLLSSILLFHVAHMCGTSIRVHPANSSLLLPHKYRSRERVIGLRSRVVTHQTTTMDPAKLRADFLQLLRSRRSPHVPLRVESAKPVEEPMYQENPPPPSLREAMESCPKADIENLKDLLVEENLYLYTELRANKMVETLAENLRDPEIFASLHFTEEGGNVNKCSYHLSSFKASEQGRLPVLILSMKECSGLKRPAIVFLHSTNKCKEWLRPLLEAYASRGYIAVAIDSRYHGERASSLTTYREALVSSWKKGDTMPFIFDTVWDLIKLADYLTRQRDDIDSTKIGITGESLGGMHAWFAAFADTRYAVVAPIIGVQGFRWAIDNDKWQGRVDSIKAVFEEACADLGKSVIDKEVVEKVWDRIAPGLASEFDAPYSVPAIAPRPLLILNGEEDPRCPLPGLDIPISRAQKEYDAHGCSDKFKLVAEPGVGHRMTFSMVKQASDWFDRFLK